MREFFTRELPPEDSYASDDTEARWLSARQLPACREPELRSWARDHVMASPAEALVVAFERQRHAQRVWIKGSAFTIPRMLGLENEPEGPASAVVVFRLTPRQYHRFHVPIDAQVTNLRRRGARHLSVHRSLLQARGTNVLTENVRTVLTMHAPHFGTFYMVIVGATCVFNVKFEDTELQRAYENAGADSAAGVQLVPPVRVRKFDELGRFLFGSTIVLVVPRDKAVVEDDLLEASERGIETQVRVGQPVIVAACAPLCGGEVQ
jgi:phosphatidylserine decarboxylase